MNATPTSAGQTSAVNESTDENLATVTPIVAKKQSLIFYKLPVFPRYIDEKLKARDVQLVTDRSCRVKIVQCLYDNLHAKIGW